MIEASGEIFRSYEVFVAKAELYRKPLWSCRYSGRGGLTFAEAAAEEDKARAALAKVRRAAGWRRVPRFPKKNRLLDPRPA